MAKKFTNFGYTTDQVEIANQNKLNSHFEKKNSNLYYYPDENADLRLRYGIIRNSQIENVEEKNSLDLTNVYNSSTGCVTIAWLQNNNNGVVTEELLSGSYDYNRDGQTQEVKDRESQYDTSSTVPNVKLTSPFIWTGDDGRSCGFNYVPPNNSIAIIGNKEFNQPQILGYVPSNASVLYPCLKPGEVSICGYGNNFIHWSQSDKISIYCKAEAGEPDIDDPDYIDNTENVKLNVADCEIEININANNRFIEIKASEEPDDTVNDGNEVTKNSNNAREVNGKQYTKILITPTDIEIRTTDEEDNETYCKMSSTEINQYVKQNDTITETTMTKDSLKQHIKTPDNETYYENDAENIKIKTKTYIVEAEEIYMASSLHTNLWSDNNINIQVPSEQGFEEIKLKQNTNDEERVLYKQGKNIIRKTLDNNKISLSTEHDDPVHKDRHLEKIKEGNKSKYADYKLYLSGCDIKIKGNENDPEIHKPVISEDDVG